MKRVLSGLGVLALAGTGAVHLYLYLDGHLPGNGVGYRQIQTVGPLFLLTVVVAGVLALAVAALAGAGRRAPRALASLVALAGAAFSASVLGGYVLTLLLPKGLFQFSEPGVSYSGALSIAAEVVGALALVALAAASTRSEEGRGQAARPATTGAPGQAEVAGAEGRQIPAIPQYR